MVREIFTWVGIEDVRSVRCADDCENAGPYPHGQGDWDRATVLGMLRNPAYMGTAHFNKVHCVPARPRLCRRRGVPEFPRRHTAKAATPPEDQIPIPVPAIVEPALSQAVQERLAEHRRHPGQAAPRPRHLLAGLVVCQRCGYAYRGRAMKKKGGSRYGYYRCYGAEAESFAGRARTATIRRSGSNVWTRRCGPMCAVVAGAGAVG